MGCRGLPARRAAVLVVLLREILPRRACGQSVVACRDRPPLIGIGPAEFPIEPTCFEYERRLTSNS